MNNALTHVLNAAKNIADMNWPDGKANARKMVALAQLEHARRALLEMQTPAANDGNRVLTPTLQELVEEGCIPTDAPNDYLTEM
jgi:hypothetical protein